MNVARGVLACAQPLAIDVLGAADTTQVHFAAATRVDLEVSAESLILTAEKRVRLHRLTLGRLEHDRGRLDP
jgi:hypothetical protein